MNAFGPCPTNDGSGLTRARGSGVHVDPFGVFRRGFGKDAPEMLRRQHDAGVMHGQIEALAGRPALGIFRHGEFQHVGVDEATVEAVRQVDVPRPKRFGVCRNGFNQPFLECGLRRVVELTPPDAGGEFLT